MIKEFQGKTENPEEYFVFKKFLNHRFEDIQYDFLEVYGICNSCR